MNPPIASPVSRFFFQSSLVLQIAIGLACGIVLALVAPEIARATGLFGDVFIAALKAVAPALVFILVASAVASHRHGSATHVRPILMLYLIGTFGAALVGVLASFAFPTSLVLDAPQVAGTPPGGIVGVLKNLLLNAVTNPVRALMEANFIGILGWAVALGACGASGVAGGSLLLIPMACNLFGIPTDVAMQVVAIGFIIGVVQDSVETALNSSTDVLFTAAACEAAAPSGA